MNGRRQRQSATFVGVFSFLILLPPAVQAQGILLPGVGAVNRSMGGASTAAPIDAAGALYWNPAAISGMTRNEVALGGELLLYSERIASRLDTATPAAGTSTGEPGVLPFATAGWIQKSEDQRWTFGLGVFDVGGVKVNFEPSTTNPILMPQTGGSTTGLGRLSSDAHFLQIVPTVSYAFTERFSFGFSPTLTMGKLSLSPLLSTPPTGPGGGVFPSGESSRWHFGAGFQLGVYYAIDSGWHFGASFKSPQWFEGFRSFVEDDTGGGRVANTSVDLPLVFSVGAAYSGIEKLLIAVDLRYFNYGGTSGFGDTTTLSPDSTLTGLDWSSSFSFALGSQYQVSDRIFLRLGYTYQQNPIRNADAFANMLTPLIQNHILSLGGTIQVTSQVGLSLAYVHAFENSVTGPWQVPGLQSISSVTNTASSDALVAGLTISY